MKIGLVLGGGGARSLTQIGVLQAMEERGIEAEVVVGCSTGGVIGALHAAGHDWRSIHDVFADFTTGGLLQRSRNWLLRENKLTEILAGRVPAAFADLDLPLAVVAVDLQEGIRVVIREGDLISALRATIALPGIMKPTERAGRVLVDGAVLDPLPVGVARAMTNLPVLAAEVAPPADRHVQIEESFLGRLAATMRGKARPLIVELLLKSYQIPTAALGRVRLALEPPDLLVRPHLSAEFTTEQFERLDEAVDAGYRAATEVFERHQELLARRHGHVPRSGRRLIR
ncbi:MAG: patatin-like phospholipase family protein [Candidatus Krumholzibacteriia bacterium]